MNSLSIIFLAAGVCYVMMGYIFKRYPPKKINALYGYRMGKALHSQKAWDLAQPYSAKQMIIQGIIFILLGALAYLIPANESKLFMALEIILPISALLFGTGVLIYKTEKYVDRNL